MPKTTEIGSIAVHAGSYFAFGIDVERDAVVWRRVGLDEEFIDVATVEDMLALPFDMVDVGSSMQLVGTHYVFSVESGVIGWRRIDINADVIVVASIDDALALADDPFDSDDESQASESDSDSDASDSDVSDSDLSDSDLVDAGTAGNAGNAGNACEAGGACCDHVVPDLPVF